MTNVCNYNTIIAITINHALNVFYVWIINSVGIKLKGLGGPLPPRSTYMTK